MNTTHPPRLIRSFVRRQGRLTPAQQHALDRLWPCYGVNPDDSIPLDLGRLFGREAPRVLEIGFGNGDALATLAAGTPDTDFLGIEVHRPGVGHLLLRLEQAGLSNVRVICADAADVLQRHIPPASLDRIQIFFPDPWPKKRHHKRRLIQPAFATRLAMALKPGGHLHLATDWEPYARQMLTVLEGLDTLTNTGGPGRFVPRPQHRPLTRFEIRGRRLGHEVRDLLFRRV